MLESNPTLRDTLETSLAAEVRRMNDHVEELQFLDLEPGTYGPVELSFAYSQGDLAAMIGVARQSVNRVLRGLERDGLVRIEGDRMFISDVDRLEARGRL